MDEADLRRWAGRSRSSSPRAERAAPAEAAAPAGALPAPPPGFGYVADAAHGYVLVPLGTAPTRQPQGVRGAPVAAEGPGGVVLPFRPRTVQLLRPSEAGEPYDAFLMRLKDIAPGQYGSHYFEAVVPDENEIAGLPEMQAVTPLNEKARVSLDPAEDAFGGRGAPATRSGPLGGGGGRAA